MARVAGSDCMLACGLVVDPKGEGSWFPSAGGNSADPRTQAVYWRCVITLFAGARITNPRVRLALFTNGVPPVVDGVSIGAVLQKYGVEVWNVPLTHRVKSVSGDWGNVLYFFDIMDALAGEQPDTRVALVDCDVLVTGELGPLFGLLDDADFGGYVVTETTAHESINGATLGELREIAEERGALAPGPFAHYGGELFLTTPRAWEVSADRFRSLVQPEQLGVPGAARLVTEEHIFTVVFNGTAVDVADANGVIKRIWTSYRLSTVDPQDRLLSLWHLPAEKNYGLRALFRALRRSGFPDRMSALRWQTLAGDHCGVTRKKPLTRTLWRAARAALYRVRAAASARGAWV